MTVILNVTKNLMKPIGSHNYYVYIVTNLNKTTLYTGVTNDLKRRLFEHETNLLDGFTQKYRVRYLVYWEHFQNIECAILREKQIKGWLRRKKEELISRFNPDWKFLNDEI